MVRLLVIAGLLAGCGASNRVGDLRFANQPPVWQVNDRVHTPRVPHKRRFIRLLYFFDTEFARPVRQRLEIRRAKPVADVNSLGEVPDSTWFVNRIGRRELTPNEVRFGPNRSGSPEHHKPWKVLGSKVGGVSVGFIIEDSRGYRYLLKFDAKGYPEMETAADVIVQRLLWACGYNVPEDDIVYFRPHELVLAKDARVSDPLGNARKMTRHDLIDNLAKVEVESDGRIRGLVSRFLSGKPLGGYSITGTRDGDPNDVIPHERRRSVRGAAAIFSWLNHTDIKEDNTLDVWAKDPEDPKRRYVMHYHVDFGKALGVLGFMDGLAFEGFSEVFDLGRIFKSLISFGIWKRPWDEIRSPPLRGVGLFESKRYEPDKWRAHAKYQPFFDRDRFDNFWGAKILIRFTRAQIRAVVEQGRLSDPRSAEYLVKTLIARQRKTAAYWFSQVAPLDRFSVEAGRLCFEDLSVRYKLGAMAKTSGYAAAFFDYTGKRLAAKARVKQLANGRVCLGPIVRGRVRRGYTIVRIDTHRRGRTMQLPVFVHLAAERWTNQLRVIGLDRR